jgi:hypothetical protein
MEVPAASQKARPRQVRTSPAGAFSVALSLPYDFQTTRGQGIHVFDLKTPAFFNLTSIFILPISPALSISEHVHTFPGPAISQPTPGRAMLLSAFPDSRSLLMTRMEHTCRFWFPALGTSWSTCSHAP